MIQPIFTFCGTSWHLVSNVPCQIDFLNKLFTFDFRTTSGRMVRRGGLLSDAQVGLEMEARAQNGIRVAQDTTTRKGLEHVSTIWTFNDGNSLESRVENLPNHTSEAQLDHIKNSLEKTTSILDQLNIPNSSKQSIAYITEFMGDHVNKKLHRELELEHLDCLKKLLQEDILTPAQTINLKELYLSACQMHSGAKVSRSFYEGMHQIQPDLGLLGKYEQSNMARPGRTFEAMGGKIVETISSVFSPDHANKNEFSRADVWRGWCAEKDYNIPTFSYVNKNRHLSSCQVQ
ncbi:unnamed protein product [Owenia fusiformis]|uniref:Uncharacterized protein n=1 Tax=Owenia fusiformis TaxID=6347 RepID=A0A8J1TF99_OWEFU|nr:unnamed protein product [Owenia fusiformis]